MLQEAMESNKDIDGQTPSTKWITSTARDTYDIDTAMRQARALQLVDPLAWKQP